MSNQARIVRPYLFLLPLLVFLLTSCSSLEAQAPVPVDENGNPLASSFVELLENSSINDQGLNYTIAELEDLAGPIALYPDNLIAIVLPASTYPLQIVMAARFLEQLESDSSLQPDENWDESVVALLNYPEVIQMMDDNIEWTWELGEAVVSQETDLLAAIGNFRDRAYNAGNLASDEYQNVTRAEEVITITQVEEKVVYVPYYVPEEVVVYQTRPVYHYYPTAYPLYYYPYPSTYRFSSGFFWGVTTAFYLGWSDHHLHVYHPSYARHPYYGYSYDSHHHYRRSDLRAFNRYYVDNHRYTPQNRQRDGSYWRPQRNSGARPSNRREANRFFGTGNSRGVSNDRRSSGGSSFSGGTRADRRNTTGITNNNRSTQQARGAQRQGNGRAGGRADSGANQSNTNSLRNSRNNGNANLPSPSNNSRTRQRNDGGTISGGRNSGGNRTGLSSSEQRQIDQAENQADDLNSSGFASGRSDRGTISNSATGIVRERRNGAVVNQGGRTADRVNQAGNTANGRQQSAAIESRTRQALQAQGRQNTFSTARQTDPGRQSNLTSTDQPTRLGGSNRRATATDRAEPTGLSTPNRRTESVRQAAPGRRAEPTRQATSNRRSESSRQAAPTRQAEPIRQAAPTRRADPVRQAAPTRRTESIRQAAPTRRAEPIRQATPNRRAEPSRRAAPSRQAQPNRSARSSSRSASGGSASAGRQSNSNSRTSNRRGVR